MPAYADTPEELSGATINLSTGTVQQVSLETTDASVSLERTSAATSKQEVVEEETTTETATTTETETTESDTASQSEESSSSIDVSAIQASSGTIAAFISAALAQQGQYQDCTAMVERALRAVGYSVGDIGPWGFTAYGVEVDPSQAQAGDILIRSGHVEIYLGNGTAVTGGYAGYQTVVYSDSPYAYSAVIRLTK